MRAVVLAYALGLAALFACTDTTTKGGDVSDASVGRPAPVPDPPAPGTGTTWPDLYRDIFAPGDGGTPEAGSGVVGSCTFKSFCHGIKGETGWTSGLRCSSQQECYASLTKGDPDAGTPGLNLVVAGEAQNSPLLTGILRAIRDGERTGIMPQEPAEYTFHPDTLRRIATWIDAGAKPD
jgi:hypothetical protein